MFKENKKEHKIKLRKKEKFFITPVRTVRLQKSAIPTMARHMNKNHEENKFDDHKYYQTHIRRREYPINWFIASFIIVPVNFRMSAHAWLHTPSLWK